MSRLMKATFSQSSDPATPPKYFYLRDKSCRSLLYDHHHGITTKTQLLDADCHA